MALLLVRIRQYDAPAADLRCRTESITARRRRRLIVSLTNALKNLCQYLLHSFLQNVYIGEDSLVALLIRHFRIGFPGQSRTLCICKQKALFSFPVFQHVVTSADDVSACPGGYGSIFLSGHHSILLGSYRLASLNTSLRVQNPVSRQNVKGQLQVCI